MTDIFLTAFGLLACAIGVVVIMVLTSRVNDRRQYDRDEGEHA